MGGACGKNRTRDRWGLFFGPGCDRLANAKGAASSQQPAAGTYGGAKPMGAAWGPMAFGMLLGVGTCGGAGFSGSRLIRVDS
jgi:hypothetical protein